MDLTLKGLHTLNPPTSTEIEKVEIQDLIRRYFTLWKENLMDNRFKSCFEFFEDDRNKLSNKYLHMVYLESNLERKVSFMTVKNAIQYYFASTDNDDVKKQICGGIEKLIAKFKYTDDKHLYEYDSESDHCSQGSEDLCNDI